MAGDVMLAFWIVVLRDTCLSRCHTWTACISLLLLLLADTLILSPFQGSKLYPVDPARFPETSSGSTTESLAFRKQLPMG
jgi:hypothetical protein